MSKFSKLQREVIRTAYTHPKGSQHRTALIAALKESGVFTEEEWAEYEEEHPNADPKFHTIITKEDREKRQKEEAEKKRKKQEEEPEKSEEPEETEETETEDQNEVEPGSEEESKRLDKAREKARESFKDAWDKGKEGLSKFKDMTNKLKGGKSTLGEAAELMAALFSAILIPDKGGDDFLKSVQERLGVKKEERDKVEESLLELKTAELAALADPEIGERMLDAVGIDPVSDEDRERYEDVARIIKGEISEEDLTDEMKDLFFNYLTDMDEARLGVLEQFVDKDTGAYDREGFKEFLEKSFALQLEEADEKE